LKAINDLLRSFCLPDLINLKVNNAVVIMGVAVKKNNLI